MRILVVEDTVDLAEAILQRFRKLGYALDWEPNGEVADEVLRRQRYDLIILDISLPGLDGRQILRRLRQRGDQTSVLVLTARAEVDDRVSALDLGADDYLVKPFDFRELEARCRALLRRGHGFASDVTEHGNLMFDRSGKLVRLQGQPLSLTGREFRLLEIFLGNMDRVVSKEDLLDQLFGFDDEAGPNAVELYVSRLRKKLSGASVVIRTVRGLGYIASQDGSA